MESAKAASSYPASAYLDYSLLKHMIYDLQVLNLREPVDENAMSLSVTPATNAAGMPLALDDEDSEDEQLRLSEKEASEGSVATHEEFLLLLEAELKKMDRFTHEQVVGVRRTLRDLEGYSKSAIAERVDEFSECCRGVGGTFLEVEKYVNLNVTAVRKLLKKHDKVLTNLPPIKPFYTARMHDMRWVRNDYSDVVVRLSKLYAKVEAAKRGGDNEEESKQYDDQSFVRTTSKFWVRPDDLSAVKLAIGEHLPVLLQPGMVKGSAKDSQLVNSVYLDSSTLELYHGRLAKSPGAVALRLRWYGTGEPTLVFVERKTHRDGWTGDESVKERFAILPEQVPLLLRGEFDADAFEASSRATGKKSEVALRNERKLVDEVALLIATKRLVPTVRSQCMRCAFQLAHTNAVRASVDTNLCLISEVQHATPPQPEVAEAVAVSSETTAKEREQSERWYRDPKASIPKNEITRFPFAVLEIKLALSENDELPDWVRKLVDSKALIPVHKFSKFIHGCAVLLPDEVQAMPYWIDDPEIAASLRASGPAAASVIAHVSPLEYARGSRPPTIANENRSPFNGIDDSDVPRFYEEEYGNSQRRSCFADCPDRADCFRDNERSVVSEMQKLMPPQKIEPKLFLAAERTFIHWLHAATVLTSLSAVCLAASSPEHKKDRYGTRRPRRRNILRIEIYATIIAFVACFMTAYALRTLSWRLDRIARRSPTEWGDPLGPLVIGGLAIFVLLLVWLVELATYISLQDE